MLPPACRIGPSSLTCANLLGRGLQGDLSLIGRHFERPSS